MIAAPRYSSHEEQRAIVGCAADLDPEKHPRRYALYLARNRKEFKDITGLPETKEEIHERQRKTRENLAEQARACSHMTARAAAEHMGITRHALGRLTKEYGLTFSGPVQRNQELLDRIEALAATGMKIAAIADQVDRAPNYIMRVVRENGFKRGPKMNLEA